MFLQYHLQILNTIQATPTKTGMETRDDCGIVVTVLVNKTIKYIKRETRQVTSNPRYVLLTAFQKAMKIVLCPSLYPFPVQHAEIHSSHLHQLQFNQFFVGRV